MGLTSVPGGSRWEAERSLGDHQEMKLRYQIQSCHHLSSGSLRWPADDRNRWPGGRVYCWDIMVSTQSKKATVMSCRQSQVQWAVSLSWVFTQSHVTSPLGEKRDILRARVYAQGCSLDPQASSPSSQMWAKGSVARVKPRPGSGSEVTDRTDGGRALGEA